METDSGERSSREEGREEGMSVGVGEVWKGGKEEGTKGRNGWDGERRMDYILIISYITGPNGYSIPCYVYNIWEI